MDFESIMLCEKSDRERQTLFISLIYGNLTIANQTHSRRDQICGSQSHKGGGRETRKVVKRYRLPVLR